MKYTCVHIESIAYHLPEKKLSSEEIELQLAPLYRRLKLPFGRLELMTGITHRRVWDSGTKPSSIALKAGQNLFEKSSLNKNDVGILINGSVCRDFLEPATASIIHSGLGLIGDCPFFDVSNACLGGLSAMTIIADKIQLGQIGAGLAICGENAGPLYEQTIRELLGNDTLNRKSIKKYMANLTIGSGACAILLCHKELAPNASKLIGAIGLSDSSSHQMCQGVGNAHSLMMETDSEGLLRAGISLATLNWQKFKNEMNLQQVDVDKIICHQVGQAHQMALLDALEIESSKDYSTYPSLGNTGSVALPITLSKAVEEGHIQKNDLVALMGIGSGLSSLVMGVRW